MESAIIHGRAVWVRPDSLKASHSIDPDAVLDMALEWLDGRQTVGQDDWDWPAILICLRHDGLLWVYDGHHRAAIAWLCDIQVIPAYIFTENELAEVCWAHFPDGEPEDMWLLDPYIVLEDGGTYEAAEIRT